MMIKRTILNSKKKLTSFIKGPLNIFKFWILLSSSLTIASDGNLAKRNYPTMEW